MRRLRGLGFSLAWIVRGSWHTLDKFSHLQRHDWVLTLKHFASGPGSKCEMTTRLIIYRLKRCQGQANSQAESYGLQTETQRILAHAPYENLLFPELQLDDGWPESEKDVFQAAPRMVVVKDSRWIVGEFYMSYGRIWCEKVRLIKKRILGKGHQMTRVLQPQRERGRRGRERERERERERDRG